MMHALYQAGQPEAPVLVLLHGTGGNEHSLLDVGRTLSPEAPLLSFRGDVLENGMRRYFKRLAEGIYDEADLAQRGDALAASIQEAAKKYDFAIDKVVLVGYSNGANIAIRLLLTRPSVFNKAILYHAMYPVKDLPAGDLSQTHVFMSFGTHDPIVSATDATYVRKLFTDRQATVTDSWTPSHQMTYQEVAESKAWLAKFRCNES